MQTVWIIGGGKFGLRAAETLRSRAPQTEILIAEKNLGCCRSLDSKGFRTMCTDGIDFLAARLENPAMKVWIVAAAPVHVAFGWVRARLSGSVCFESFAMPAEFVRLLPNAMHGAEGQFYASNADFICPSDCSESGRLCSFTGRRRPRSMHAFLRRLPSPGVKILVVRSFQLAPGVGGLRPRDLFEALRQTESALNPVLLATACKCHAVMNSFKIKPIG